MATKKKVVAKIEFDNEEAAIGFFSWLCESGEQQYWDYQEYREQEEDGPITAIDFNYHGKDDVTGKEEFAANLTIKAKCGRLDRK